MTAVKELLQYYPTSPAAGSPYGTGNNTFGRSVQYKRFASLLGDLLFQVRSLCWPCRNGALNGPILRLAAVNILGLQLNMVSTAGKCTGSLFTAQHVIYHKSRSYLLKEPSSESQPEYGVSHGGDIPFVMQNLHILFPNAPPARIELEETIGDYWYVIWLTRLYAWCSLDPVLRINFAYNLDPNTRSGPKRKHSYASSV